MTSAELKTLREACGLSQAWLATRHGNNLRTVRYWESGKSSVPDDIAHTVTTIDAMLDRGAAQELATAQLLRAQHDAPEVVELYRYSTDAELWAAHPEMRPLPVMAHAAMLYRAAQLLIDAGFTVQILWKSAKTQKTELI